MSHVRCNTPRPLATPVAQRHLKAEVATCVGGVLSPLLANIALSALDDHFAREWQQKMGTPYQRSKRKKNGHGNWKIIRYADLCRARHKSAYAEVRIMPTIMPDALVRAVGGVLMSA